MNSVDFAALWFGRVWGCFWIGLVFFIAWLVVRDRVVTRRARRAAQAESLRASMRAHPAGDDWRDDWRHDGRDIETADLALWDLECSFPTDGAS